MQLSHQRTRQEAAVFRVRDYKQSVYVEDSVSVVAALVVVLVHPRSATSHLL